MKSRAALAVIAILLVSASAQSASAALGPTEPLSAEGIFSTDEVETHISAAGNATAIWMSREESFSAFDLVSRTRTASTGWSAPETISDSRPVGEDFDVAFSDNGHVVVAWAETDRSIWAAHRSPSGIWGDPVEIQEAEIEPGARAVRVAVDPQGNAVVVFRDNRDAPVSQVGEASYRSGGSGTWDAPDEIVSEYSGEGIDVVYDNAGNFVSVWYSQGTPGFVKSATRPVGDLGDWSAPDVLTTSNSVPSFQPAIAADPAGNVTAVWGQYVVIDDNANSEDRLWSSHRPVNGSWQGPVTVSAAGSMMDRFLTQRPLLFAHPDGKATAGWIAEDGADTEFLFSTMTGVGVWSAPNDIDAMEGEIDNIAGAVDADGLRTFAWRRTVAGVSRTLRARTLSTAGTFGTLETLSQVGAGDDSPDSLSVSAAGSGGAAVAWKAHETTATPPARTWVRYSAPTPAPPPVVPLPVTTPTIGTVRILPKKIYRKARVRGSKKKRKTAAKVQFSLTEQADVTLTLALRIKGKVVGGKCVRATKRNTRRRSCELVVPWGKPIPVGRQPGGAVSIPFTSKGLRNGNYYLNVNAVSPTGQTAAPKRTKLTIG